MELASEDKAHAQRAALAWFEEVALEPWVMAIFTRPICSTAIAILKSALCCRKSMVKFMATSPH